jgi:hypothetical protein
MLEHGALARTIVTDDAEGLTLSQVEGNVIEDPELLRRKGAFAIATDRALYQ